MENLPPLLPKYDYDVAMSMIQRVRLSIGAHRCTENLKTEDQSYSKCVADDSYERFKLFFKQCGERVCWLPQADSFLPGARLNFGCQSKKLGAEILKELLSLDELLEYKQCKNTRQAYWPPFSSCLIGSSCKDLVYTVYIRY